MTVLALALAASLSASAADTKAAAPTAAAADASGLQTEDQKTLYALGIWVSQRVAPFALSADDLKYVQQGMTDGVLGNKPKVDLDAYGDKLNELAGSRMKVKAEANKKAGADLAAKAAKEKGAKKEKSGLVYVELKKGDGPSPKAEDTVKVHYEGKLVDGTVFDSSYQRNQPAEFPLNGVIKCWTEGVQKMKVGGKARLICPSDIAYGDQGRPGAIPPGATLDFTVELLEVQKAQAPEKAPMSSEPKKK